MDHLFRDVKPTRKSVELKEEILQNLVDKYHDMIAEGRTPEAAYNIAVASIGDMDELLAGLHGAPSSESLPATKEVLDKGRRKSAVLISVAVMMYIMSILPPILLSDTVFENKLAPALMFIMIAVATALLIYNNLTKPRYQRTDDSIV